MLQSSPVGLTHTSALYTLHMDELDSSHCPLLVAYSYTQLGDNSCTNASMLWRFFSLTLLH